MIYSIPKKPMRYMFLKRPYLWQTGIKAAFGFGKLSLLKLSMLMLPMLMPCGSTKGQTNLPCYNIIITGI